MLRICLFGALLLTTGLVGAARAQDEPKKKVGPEWVPVPKAIAPLPSIIIEPYQPRQDTREVWQHYGLNAGGRMVPRVINTPYGYYYSRNLEPYPWAGTRPRAFVP